MSLSLLERKKVEGFWDAVEHQYPIIKKQVFAELVIAQQATTSALAELTDAQSEAAKREVAAKLHAARQNYDRYLSSAIQIYWEEQQAKEGLGNMRERSLIPVGAIYKEATPQERAASLRALFDEWAQEDAQMTPEEIANEEAGWKLVEQSLQENRLTLPIPDGTAGGSGCLSC